MDPNYKNFLAWKKSSTGRDFLNHMDNREIQRMKYQNEPQIQSKPKLNSVNSNNINISNNPENGRVNDLKSSSDNNNNNENEEKNLWDLDDILNNEELIGDLLFPENQEKNAKKEAPINNNNKNVSNVNTISNVPVMQNNKNLQIPVVKETSTKASSSNIEFNSTNKLNGVIKSVKVNFKNSNINEENDLNDFKHNKINDEVQNEDKMAHSKRRSMAIMPSSKKNNLNLNNNDDDDQVKEYRNNSRLNNDNTAKTNQEAGSKNVNVNNQANIPQNTNNNISANYIANVNFNNSSNFHYTFKTNQNQDNSSNLNKRLSVQNNTMERSFKQNSSIGQNNSGANFNSTFNKMYNAIQKNNKNTESSSINFNSKKKRNIYFQIVSKESIAIECDFFLEPALMTIIKEHQGRFDREARLWYAPYKNYIQIFQKLKECQALGETNLFPITNLPVEKSPYEIDYSKDRVHTIFELPSNMLTSLYNFQKIGIEFGINKKGRMLLADEMGVGKTIQAIGISAIYREDWPVLILCPSSLKYNWRDEILNWLGEIVDKKEVQIIKKSKDEFDKEMKFCICSYDLSIRKADSIQEKNFKFAIADEAHYLKSKESKRSKLMIPILQRCKRLLLLSGTPILAKPVEIYPLLKALRPDIFSSFKAFGTRYCDPKNTAFGVDWSGASNSKELHFIISNFMIRRLKKDVLAELPPKKRQKVEIQTDKKVINQIRVLLNKVNKKELENDEVVLKLIDEQNNSNEDKPEDSLNCFTKAYSLTGKAKITGIVDYVNYLLVNKCKFLIFAHHLEVLDSIEEEVKKQEVKYIRIDGSLNQEKRHICVNIFQNDETCLVAILAITACATGLTLTKASTVVFTEMHFTPAIMIQAEDRAHRIGQEHTCVNVHYLYGADTVDEILFPKLREKFFVVSTTLDDKRMDMDVQKIKSGCIGDFETKNKKENESKSGHFNQNEKVLKLNNDNKNHSGRKTLTDYFHVINKKKKDEAQDENKETSISNTENVNDINLHEGEKKRNRNMLDDCCTDSSILENSFEWIEERGDVFNKNSKFDEEGI